MEVKVALSFDDVLLIPQHSEIASRKDPSTVINLSKNVTLQIPIISSCMDTVTGTEMAIAMWKMGGLGIIHRYNTIQEQIDMLVNVFAVGANCAIAIGATGDFFERAKTLVDHGANILCIDVAHGDSMLVENAIKVLRSNFTNNLTIIAGNVATGPGCERLINAGADAIRCGIGGGSLCTTRIITAHGIPTLQTIMDCKEYLYVHGYKDYCLLADGGIRNSGDLVKSIAAGANAVILGQLLAATTESPGKLIETRDRDNTPICYKKYRGMASYQAQADWRPETRNNIVPEGEETILEYKGNMDKIINRLVGGLRSGMTYSNAMTIQDLQYNARFIQITSSGLQESKPHAKT